MFRHCYLLHWEYLMFQSHATRISSRTNILQGSTGWPQPRLEALRLHHHRRANCLCLRCPPKPQKRPARCVHKGLRPISLCLSHPELCEHIMGMQAAEKAVIQLLTLENDKNYTVDCMSSQLTQEQGPGALCRRSPVFCSQAELRRASLAL